MFGPQNWTHHSRWGFTRVGQKVRISSLDLWPLFFWCLAFWASRSLCCIMLNFSSTNTPKAFSSGLFSTHSFPSLCLGLPWLGFSTLHLALLKFMRFAQAQLCGKVPQDGFPSLQPANHGLLWSANLMKLQSIPLSTKVLNCARPDSSPWGAPLIHVPAGTPGHWPQLHNSGHPANPLPTERSSYQIHVSPVLRQACHVGQCQMLAEMQAHAVSYSSLSDQGWNPLREGHQSSQGQFTLSRAPLGVHQTL